MSKQCKCEHWQECPVCMPHRFDADGNRKPPEPTPLQAAQSRIAELEAQAREHALQRVSDFGQIQALTEERDALRERVRELTTQAMFNASTIERLRAEVAGLREDAERYREWKRAFREGECALWNALCEGQSDAEHDAAIDAALAARKGEA